jgi:hypothetical protein
MLKDMETQFINDENGRPDKVNITMDYSDYLKIAEQLNLPLSPNDQTKGREPFDKYTLTESANSILTGLIALASREELLEAGKPNPDQSRIDALKALGNDAMQQYRNNDNFSSLEKMEAIIDKYSPILLAEKKKLQF